MEFSTNMRYFIADFTRDTSHSFKVHQNVTTLRTKISVNLLNQTETHRKRMTYETVAVEVKLALPSRIKMQNAKKRNEH